jgi:hypothetical protein
MVAEDHSLRILSDMVWEGRIVSAGEWVECKISVATASGDNFSWVGQLMMRPLEWRDFCSRMNLSEVSEDLWLSDAAEVPPAPQA